MNDMKRTKYLFYATLAISIIGAVVVSGCVKQGPEVLVGNETLEVTVLTPNGSPLGNIEVDLWKKDTRAGPPDASFAVTDEDGIIVFNIPEGEYQIGFNLVNFPENLIYPEKESVLVEKGIVSKKTITLEVKEESGPEERKLVALGDSFTKANNPSSDLVGDHEEFSFSTGTEINSLYLYLKSEGENITPVNLAESGATSGSILESQVPNVAGFHPKYVTLLAGGADILEGVSVGEYEQNLQEIIGEIESDDTTILIATNPNVAMMRTASYPSCNEDTLGLNVERITEEKLQSFNQVVKDIATQHGLVLVDLYDTLGPSDVSDYDCLHPNMGGQEKVAQAFIEALPSV